MADKSTGNVRMSRTLPHPFRRLRGLLGSVPMTKSLGQRLSAERDALVKSGSRAPLAVGPLAGDMVRDGMFKHVIDQRAMVLAVNNNWMLGAALDKIGQEVTKNIPDDTFELFKPKFKKECQDCGTKFQFDVLKCEVCKGTNLREPDRRQLKRVLQFFERPNSSEDGSVEQTVRDIVKALAFYHRATGDYYLEVLYDLAGNPAEMYAATSEYIRLVPPGGKLGGLFCELCWREHREEYKPEEEEACPRCGRPLAETKYVQIDDADHVVARYSDAMLKHGKARSFGRRAYASSPIESVWAAAQTLRWMELFQWSMYSNNKSVNSVVYIPQLSQDEINDIMDDIMERKRLNPGTPQHLWIGGGGREGSGQPAVIDTMPTLVDLNAKEMALFEREAISIRYGVSLNLLGVQTPGKLGNETEIIEVSFDAILEVKGDVEDFFNNKVIVLFKVHPFGENIEVPEVTDWRFELPPPKTDDAARKEQVETSRIDKAQKLEQMGFVLEFDDEFNVRVTGRTKPAAQPMAPGMPGQPQPGQPEDDLLSRLQSMKPGESIDIPEAAKPPEPAKPTEKASPPIPGENIEESVFGTHKAVEYEVAKAGEPVEALDARVTSNEKAIAEQSGKLDDVLARLARLLELEERENGPAGDVEEDPKRRKAKKAD